MNLCLFQTDLIHKFTPRTDTIIVKAGLDSNWSGLVCAPFHVAAHSAESSSAASNLPVMAKGSFSRESTLEARVPRGKPRLSEAPSLGEGRSHPGYAGFQPA